MVAAIASQSNPIPADRSFVVQHAIGGRWGYMVHAHPCFELIHIPRGHGHALVGDHVGEFHLGYLFLVAPGVPHSFHSEGFLPNGELLEMQIFYFNPDLVDVQRVPELASLGPLLARARRGLLYRGPVVDEIGDRLREMRSTTPGAQVVALGYRALDRLAREDEVEILAEHETSSRFRGEEMVRLDAVRSVIRRRFREPIGLDDVAHEAGMSASTLNHLLHKYSQTTFLAYLTDLRLDEAKRLLRETDRDITDIAFEAGFGSLATFNRRFRADDSKTPQQYRGEHR
jgi:AraC-like DNA-binding protein